MKKIIVLSFVLLVTSLVAVDARVDSLKNKLLNADSREKVHLYNELGKLYWGVSSEKTHEYSNLALELSQNINYLKGEAQSLNNIGVGYYFSDDYDNALVYFKKSLEIRREIGDKKDIVASLNNIGIIYDDLNMYDEALDYYLQSLELFEDIGDNVGVAVTLHNVGVVYESLSNYNKSLEYLLRALKVYEEIGDKTGVASSYGNIGIVYKDLSNYDKSLEYHLKSLKISREIDDVKGIANSLDNIGIIYENLNNYEKAIEYYSESMKIESEIGDDLGVASSLNNIGIIYDEQGHHDMAIDNYNRALEMYRSIGFKNGVANTLNNLGVVYENQLNYPEALKYHKEALEIFYDIGHKKGYAASLNNIGSVYIKMSDYVKGVDYLEQALVVASSIETKDLVIEIYGKLSSYYESVGDYQTALYNFKLFSAIKDSIFNKEKIEKIAGMQTTYEVEHLLEQQENEIELLTKDNEIYRLQVEKQHLTNWRFYLGFIILLVVFSFVYYRYRMKYRANQILRKQVDERTRDLTISNVNLKNEIRERKRIQSKLIRSERLAGIGELAAGIAHEIRNPLGNISSSAQYSMRKFEMDSSLKRYFEIIVEESRKANAIIKGLLDFANPREMKFQTGSIDKVIDSVLTSVEGRNKESKVSVVTQSTDGNIEVKFDKKWLEQALLNFVLNAIQSMPFGGVLTITEEFDKTKNLIKIIISDTGNGIAKEDLKKIFDPFYTTREDGVGLGLSLAHQIIQDHNGELQIDSELGEGTDVTVSLPVN